MKSSAFMAFVLVTSLVRGLTGRGWLLLTVGLAATLLLPLEVRILPSYEIVQSLGMVNTYSGLIVPLASIVMRSEVVGVYVVDDRGRVFFRQVRLGSPQYVEGLKEVVRNPIHATGVGLLLYGYENMARRDGKSTPIGGGLGDVWQRMKAWFSGQF